MAGIAHHVRAVRVRILHAQSPRAIHTRTSPGRRRLTLPSLNVSGTGCVHGSRASDRWRADTH